MTSALEDCGSTHTSG